MPLPTGAVITLREHGMQIRIEGNGVVYFEAQTFEFDLGRIRTSITQSELRELIAEFERINFFSLADRYYDKKDGCRGVGTGCNFLSVTTSFSLKGKSKSITRFPLTCKDEDGSEYPRELAMLEQRIKELVDLRRR